LQINYLDNVDKAKEMEKKKDDLVKKWFGKKKSYEDALSDMNKLLNEVKGVIPNTSLAEVTTYNALKFNFANYYKVLDIQSPTPDKPIYETIREGFEVKKKQIGQEIITQKFGNQLQAAIALLPNKKMKDNMTTFVEKLKDVTNDVDINVLNTEFQPFAQHFRNFYNKLPKESTGQQVTTISDIIQAILKITPSINDFIGNLRKTIKTTFDYPTNVLDIAKNAVPTLSGNSYFITLITPTSKNEDVFSEYKPEYADFKLYVLKDIYKISDETYRKLFYDKSDFFDVCRLLDYMTTNKYYTERFLDIHYKICSKHKTCEKTISAFRFDPTKTIDIQAFAFFTDTLFNGLPSPSPSNAKTNYNAFVKQMGGLTATVIDYATQIILLSFYYSEFHGKKEITYTGWTTSTLTYSSLIATLLTRIKTVPNERFDIITAVYAIFKEFKHQQIEIGIGVNLKSDASSTEKYVHRASMALNEIASTKGGGGKKKTLRRKVIKQSFPHPNHAAKKTNKNSSRTRRHTDTNASTGYAEKTNEGVRSRRLSIANVSTGAKETNQGVREPEGVHRGLSKGLSRGTTTRRRKGNETTVERIVGSKKTRRSLRP